MARASAPRPDGADTARLGVPFEATTGSRAEQAVWALYLATLVWAPLPFASNRPWGAGLLVFLVCGLTAAWLFLYLRGSARLQDRVWRSARPALAVLLVVQAWVAVQLLPLPAQLVASLSPLAYQWHLEGDWLTLSLDPGYGWAHLLQGLSLSAGFFLTLALVNCAARLRLLLAVLVFSGLLQAVYGGLMVLSGLELGFFVEKYAGRGVATGTFVNRNHLAGYLVMCLAAGIGLLLAGTNPRRSVTGRQWARQGLRLVLSPRLQLRIYLAVMVIALVLTRSRTGNVAFFAALAIAGAVALYHGQRFSGRLVVLLLSLLLVDLLLLGGWFGFDKVVERLQYSELVQEERWWSGAYVLDYIARFPVTGSGGGSFYGIFANFQGPELQGFHIHAHNDYLEFAAELGLPAAVVLAAVPLLALVAAIRAQGVRRHPLLRGAAFTVTMVVAWCFLHSFTDFNLQIPANALTFVTLLAIAFVARSLPGSGPAMVQ